MQNFVESDCVFEIFVESDYDYFCEMFVESIFATFYVKSLFPY